MLKRQLFNLNMIEKFSDELIVGDFGPAFPGGLFIAQDGMQAGGAQNFKLVAWDDIKAAIGLPN